MEIGRGEKTRFDQWVKSIGSYGVSYSVRSDASKQRVVAALDRAVYENTHGSGQGAARMMES